MKQLLLILCSCLGLGGAAESPGLTLPAPPDRSSLLGNWVGFDAEGAFFFRLVLKDEGGLFSYSFSDYPPRSYKVASWSLKESTIDIKMTGLTEVAETMHVLGRASSHRLDVKIEGDRGSWTQSTAMLREEKITSRIKRLQETMNSEGDRVLHKN